MGASEVLMTQDARSGKACPWCESEVELVGARGWGNAERDVTVSEHYCPECRRSYEITVNELVGGRAIVTLVQLRGALG